MKTKTIIFAFSLLFVTVAAGYKYFSRKEELTYDFTIVKVGNIIQEVSATGQVKKGEEINLGFKNSGEIEEINVEVGQKVKEGQVLVKLDTTQFQIQLQEAKAILETAQVNLNKLLAGVSQEEIQVAKTTVDNAQTSLGQALQSLENIETQAEEDLKAVYEDALIIIEDSYLKTYSAFNVAELVQQTYFPLDAQERLEVRDNKDKIKQAANEIKACLDTAKTLPTNEDIDTALSVTEKELEDASDALKFIRETCNKPAYRDIVSLSDKTSLDAQRGYILTALTNISNSQQTISLIKITNTTNVDAAQAKVSSAEGSLKAAEDQFTLLIAEPRQEDIDLCQAQIKQTQSKVQLLQSQMRDAILKSPFEGEVIRLNKKEGEQVQAMMSDIVISLIPTSPFQINVDIYEEDIVKVGIGNPVDIALPALSEKILKGRVISIEPAEKLIGGVVYYEVAIGFDEEPPKEIKPGMTADIVIIANSKENVLIIPEDAIQKKNGKIMVQVFRDGLIQDREIEIGLKGSDDKVEVVSGLEEGEEIILR